MWHTLNGTNSNKVYEVKKYDNSTVCRGHNREFEVAERSEFKMEYFAAFSQMFTKMAIYSI